jgi:SAM-dependent methyltransferase
VSRFEDLLAEGESVPVAGWDFSWFAGREAGSQHPRATEGRPPWGYARLLGRRLAALAGVPGAAALDLQTGGGEVLAAAVSTGLSSGPAAPPTLVATESWPPNVAVAERNLAPLGARVVAVPGPDSDLPFPDASFDLVTSRHPVSVRWDEVARVLKPGGRYFSQDVGHPSVGELSEYMLGPRPEPAPDQPDQPDQPDRDPKWSVLAAQRAGLTVADLREYRGRIEFNDVAAVVVFLRKVIWIVPGFTVAGYRDRLRALHEQIERDGPFLATTVRFLIEARN